MLRPLVGHNGHHIINSEDFTNHLQTDMRLHLDLSCVKLNKTEDQLRNTQEKLEKFEKITRKLEEKVIGLENRLMQCSEEHTWKVTGINSLLSTLKPETAESAPFYTKKYGYKFNIRLCSRGLNFWMNKPFLVYFILMKGDYDAILPWPFNKKLAFTLTDQQEIKMTRKLLSKILFSCSGNMIKKKINNNNKIFPNSERNKNF